MRSRIVHSYQFNCTTILILPLIISFSIITISYIIPWLSNGYFKTNYHFKLPSNMFSIRGSQKAVIWVSVICYLFFNIIHEMRLLTISPRINLKIISLPLWGNVKFYPSEVIFKYIKKAFWNSTPKDEGLNFHKQKPKVAPHLSLLTKG